MINVFIKTYGCQANVADSDGIMNYLSTLGCNQVPTEELADMIIINTCAIRERAEQKLFSYIGQLDPYKQTRPHLAIGIIGCVASYRKQDIYKRFDYVTFVYGARDEISTLQAYLADLIVTLETTKQLYANTDQQTHKRTIKRTFDIKQLVEHKNLLAHTKSLVYQKSISGLSTNAHEATDTPNPLCHPELDSGSTPQEKTMKRAMINIMTGCNKYCSYCIVPFTRGQEISYPMSEILTTVQHELGKGTQEINLLGQNVNSYKDPKTGARFPELMERVAQMDGNFWIRFVSPHPQDLTKDLFNVMAHYKDKLTAAIHFPLQSGSNKILQLMNRNYTREEFLEKVGWIKDLLPAYTLSTDIIIGFPEETTEDYWDTRDIMEQVKFDMIYSFVYSRRKYTKAFDMPNSTSKDVQYQRLIALQARQKDIALERNSRLIGKKLKVLVEKRLPHGKLLARTEGNIRVELDGDDVLIATFIDVTIDKAGPAVLDATRI